MSGSRESHPEIDVVDQLRELVGTRQPTKYGLATTRRSCFWAIARSCLPPTSPSKGSISTDVSVHLPMSAGALLFRT